MQSIGASLGFTGPELDQLKSDNNVIQFLATTATTLDAYHDAVRQYRIIMTEGNTGEATSDFPASISPTLPVIVPTGIFERMEDMVKRTRVALNYTDEIGHLNKPPEKPVSPSLQFPDLGNPGELTVRNLFPRS